MFHEKSIRRGVFMHIPGELKDPADIKLLILYVFNCVKRPMTLADITNAVRYYNLANYFDMAESIEQLVESSNLYKEDIDGVIYYTPSSSGIKTLNELEKRLPYSTREKAQKAALLTRASMIRQNQVNVTSKPVPTGGKIVTFNLNDETIDMFKLSVYVPNDFQEKIVKENFLANAEDFYITIIEMLTTQTPSPEAKKEKED